MRLDRYVSQASACSRRQARILVRDGRVRVDGAIVNDAGAVVTHSSTVVCDGAPLRLPGSVYLMMHKPCGLLSATRDAHQPTVMSLLPDDLAERVHLVGRLDKDTSGLLLLTDDGAWSHRISSPRRHCVKVYLVDLAEPLVGDAEQRLAAGLLLRGEATPTRPATLQRVSDLRARLTIDEGRYHQVRRMFAALGNRVTTLHRERVGGLSLDGRLAPGQWRELAPDDRRAVFG